MISERDRPRRRGSRVAFDLYGAAVGRTGAELADDLVGIVAVVQGVGVFVRVTHGQVEHALAPVWVVDRLAGQKREVAIDRLQGRGPPVADGLRGELAELHATGSGGRNRGLCEWLPCYVRLDLSPRRNAETKLEDRVSVVEVTKDAVEHGQRGEHAGDKSECEHSHLCGLGSFCEKSLQFFFDGQCAAPVPAGTCPAGAGRSLRGKRGRRPPGRQARTHRAPDSRPRGRCY